MNYIGEAMSELQDIINVLNIDVITSLQMIKHDRNKGLVNQMFWRRTFVRAMFAHVEGVVYRMKQVALEHHVLPDVGFTAAEFAMLMETTYKLNGKGEAVEETARISTSDNIKFAFKIFAYATKSGYELDIKEGGWNAFQASSSIRNRLMHPKNVESLIISDKELEIIQRAAQWFATSVSEALNATTVAYSHRHLQTMHQ